MHHPPTQLPSFDYFVYMSQAKYSGSTRFASLAVAFASLTTSHHPPAQLHSINLIVCMSQAKYSVSDLTHRHILNTNTIKKFTQPLAQPNICVKATSINVLSRISGVQKILPFKIIFLQTQESGVTHIRLTLNCALNISGSKSLFFEVKGLSYTPMTTTGLPTNISFSK
jgi:hypothetical protein